MSTHPGVTTRPSASMVRRAAAPRRAPTEVMRPRSTATSAVRDGAPVPSTRVPPEMRRSCTGRVWRARGCGVSADDCDLVRRFWDALYARDWGLVRTFFDDRSEYWDVPDGPAAAAVGPADIEARLKLGIEPLAG